LYTSVSLWATDYSSIIEQPDATKIIKKDKLAPAKVYKMPKDCVSMDRAVLARGAYIFHHAQGLSVEYILK